MRNYTIAGASIGVALTTSVLDFVWLGLVSPAFYQSQLGPMLLPQPNLIPALAFYVLYVAGLMVFCVTPALALASWRKAALLGAMFGLVAYGMYDLSNLATLKGWTVNVAIVDMLWGSALSASASCCGYFCGGWFKRSRKNG